MKAAWLHVLLAQVLLAGWIPGVSAAAAEEAVSMAIEGRDGWLFLAPELRFLSAGRFWGEAAPSASRAAKAEHADPLPAILDFHRRLKDLGVELILVPVPAKAAIYPEFLPEGRSLAPSCTGEFYELLRSRGVQVLDLSAEFKEGPPDDHGELYCRQDSHWSGNGCVTAARDMARRIRAVPELPVAGTGFTSEWVRAEISGDLWMALNNPSIPKEVLSLRRVGRPGATGIEPVEPDESSAVLLLGDSHNLVFHAGGDLHARGAGLPDQLALELGFPVDLIAVRGSGATPARINLLRRVQKNPDYWKNKKCVVWCFAVREFTESDGWRIIPISSGNREK